MDTLGKANVVRRVGGVLHFVGILAGASAAFNLFSGLGRYISYQDPLPWGPLLYRVFLATVLIGGGLALGRLADRLAAGGDADRAAAAQAERDEVDRLTRGISVPRRRNHNR